ncbi:MAG: metallophosphoesterase [Nannocystaceae bacterium]|nr:metallophosphoesterase [Nannocystaceae bacterium]
MHDIIVVSDLHIGRGKNRNTGRYFELETFFYDEDFHRFCEYLCKQSHARDVPFKLVFNGDTFDFLRLDPVPEAVGGKKSAFSPVMTPQRAAMEVESILVGHPLFLEGVVSVLASGNEVLMMPGNHDIEVQWGPVQAAMREAIREHSLFAGDEERAERALSRLEFRPWFYYEEGRIWIEHGCQYDPENAFRYPLREGLVEAGDALHEAELDNPLGNFFQRYLYNAFGHITFIVPSTRANTRYLKWLLFNQPQLLLRIVKSHWRFWWQIVRRVTQYPSRQRNRLAAAHEKRLHELAEESALGDTLLEIDAMKETRADISAAINGFGRAAIKGALSLLLVGVLVLGLWFAAIHGLNQIQMGLLGKAAVFLAFGFLFLFSAFGSVLYLLLRSNATLPPQPMRRAASKLARMVDVPIVTFGHSHDEVLWRQDLADERPSWYYNTGTWIAVFTHDVLLPRERVQFTFLRVRDKSAELLHWSPGRGEPLPVILLDEEPRSGAPIQAAGTMTGSMIGKIGFAGAPEGAADP